MKTKNVGILTQLLMALMVLAIPFFALACAEDNNSNNANEVDLISSSESHEEETTEIQSPIPKDVTFDGEKIRILNSTYFPEELVFVNAEDEIGEVVNDAIYNRNIKVQNDLNVTFEFIDVSLVQGGDFQRMVRNSVSAGSNDYDLLFGVQYDTVQLATAGMFQNLSGAPYINLENPWWAAKNIQDELTIGNENLFFLTGDISLNFVRNMGCAFYNKQLYEEYFGDSDDMYKLVLDGKWTIDKLSEMVKTVYKDLNGDGQSDSGDQYGCGVIIGNLTDHFTYAAGIRVTARDAEDIPYLVMNNEKTINFVDKLYNLFYANEGVSVFPSTEETNQITIPAKFMKNELLFDFGWFYISELLRDMKTDYGIIPFPKYDENQPEYLSLAHDIVPLYCVPVTIEKMEAVGAVLEAMAFESYRTVLPAYYEVALKLKYSRDTVEDAFTIIDMIHDNVTTDFAYVYNYALNNVGLIMRDLMGAKSADFVSRYDRMETRVQSSLEKIIDAYMQTNN